MFLPENINLAHSESYDLSIRLTPDGFSFYIFSADDPSVFHYQETGMGSKFSYTENIKRLIFDLGFFSQPFNCTKVTVVSPGYTLVPTAFFDKKRTRELLQYNFHAMDGRVLDNAVSPGGYHIVYQMDEEVHSFLSRNLWNPSFQHHAATLLPLFSNHASDRNDQSYFIDFHDGYVSVACFKQKELLSFNMFPATHPRDTLYYITNVLEKGNFDQSADAFFIMGHPTQQQSVIKELTKIISQVEHIQLKPKVSITEEQQHSLSTDILATL